MKNIEKELLEIKNKQYIAYQKIKTNNALLFIIIMTFIMNVIIMLLNRSIISSMFVNKCLRFGVISMIIAAIKQYNKLKIKKLDKQAKDLLIPELKELDKEIKTHTYVMEYSNGKNKDILFDKIINNSSSKELREYRELLLAIKANESKMCKDYKLIGDEDNTLVMKFKR